MLDVTSGRSRLSSLQARRPDIPGTQRRPVMRDRTEIKPARRVASPHGFQATADSPRTRRPRHGRRHCRGHEGHAVGCVAAAQDPAGGAGRGPGGEIRQGSAAYRGGTGHGRRRCRRVDGDGAGRGDDRHVPARLADAGGGGLLSQRRGDVPSRACCTGSRPSKGCGSRRISRTPASPDSPG